VSLEVESGPFGVFPPPPPPPPPPQGHHGPSGSNKTNGGGNGKDSGPGTTSTCSMAPPAKKHNSSGCPRSKNKNVSEVVPAEFLILDNGDLRPYLMLPEQSEGRVVPEALPSPQQVVQTPAPSPMQLMTKKSVLWLRRYRL
jgi:hypothetical protein